MMHNKYEDQKQPLLLYGLHSCCSLSVSLCTGHPFICSFMPFL